MDSKQLELLARLPGLQVAKQLLEQQIAEIERYVYGNTISPAGQPAQNSSNVVAPIPGAAYMDLMPKRRRNLSPEVRQRKRELIAQAREKKLAMLRTQKNETLPSAANTASTVAEHQHAMAASEAKAPVTSKSKKSK